MSRQSSHSKRSRAPVQCRRSGGGRASVVLRRLRRPDADGRAGAARCCAHVSIASSSPAPGSRPWRPSWRCATSPATASRSTSSPRRTRSSTGRRRSRRRSGSALRRRSTSTSSRDRYAVDAGGGGAGRRRRRRAERSPRLGRGARLRLPAGRRRREARVGAARARSRSAGRRTCRWSSGCSPRSRAAIAGRSSSSSRPGPRGRCRRTSWRSWRARRCARCPDATVTLVTPEREPLWIFGEAAGAALRELLPSATSTLRTEARAAHVTDDVLWLESGDAVIADTVISLPRLVGPAIPGLPGDRRRLPAHRRPRLRDGGRAACSPPATPRPSRSSRAASRPSRRTPPPPRSRTRSAPPSSRGRSRRCCAGCCSPAGRRCTCAPSSTARARSARAARGTGAWRARCPRARCGGRPARSPAATSLRTCRRRARRRSATSRSSTACRERPTADAAERDAALELALLLADEDAAAGDLHQALHALDAAAALAGGVLPAAYAERRERWLARLGPARERARA